MLNVIRKHTQAWIIKAVLGAIIIVFIFWGIGTVRSRRADTVARVNGQVITRTDYQKAYSRAVDNYQRIYGDAFSEDLLKAMNLKKMVLEGLVREVLVQKGAADLDIRISDEEIKRHIADMRVFREGGQFDPERYRQALESAQLTPALFEEGLRKDLLWGKVAETLGRSAKVSEDEVWSAFQYANRQIKLAYVSFATAAFKDRVKAGEAVLLQYFTGHQEEYRVPARVRVLLARFLFKDYADRVKVSAEEMESYYKSNLEEFREPERRRLSQVFFALSPSLSSEEIAGVQARAGEVLKKAKAGGDFASLARQFSEDRSAINGGDIGYLRRGTVDPSFEEMVFSLEKGAVSPLVTSKNGLHILKVTDIIPSRVKPLAAVQADIRRTLSERKIQELVGAEAAKTYERVIRSGGLERYAQSQHLPLVQTGFFSEQDEVEGVGRELNFNRAALALKKGELSSLIKLSQGYFICEAVERKESFIPGLEEVKTKVKTDFVRDKARHLAESEANRFISELKDQGKSSALAYKYGLMVRETEYVNPTALSNSGFLFAGSKPELSTLTGVNWYIQHPIKVEDVFYVVSLADTREAPKDLYDRQRDTIKEALLRMQKDAILKGWIEGLREKAEIEYGEEFENYR